jgi:hypothetical protein
VKMIAGMLIVVLHSRAFKPGHQSWISLRVPGCQFRAGGAAPKGAESIQNQGTTSLFAGVLKQRNKRTAPNQNGLRVHKKVLPAAKEDCEPDRHVYRQGNSPRMVHQQVRLCRMQASARCLCWSWEQQRVLQLSGLNIPKSSLLDF